MVASVDAEKRKIPSIRQRFSNTEI